MRTSRDGSIPMDAAAFVEKWRHSTRSEKSAASEHFLDLCELVQHPKPGDVDAQGLSFTMEKRVKKFGGGMGFADAWKKDHFAWEYKSRGFDLDPAFNQLLQYSGDLGNPPLLVASDMDRIEIRTRFNGFPTTTHAFDLATLALPKNLDLLRRVFHDPESLRPEETIEKITEKAAKDLAEIAPRIRQRHDDPTKVAHFLDRLVFCLFAEDYGLLPNKVFTRIIEKYAIRPNDKITADIGLLFAAMAQGGDVYGETIPHINGNLFDGGPPLLLDAIELEAIHKAAALDWSQMDPSIFGTLFERVMDPNQRSRLGAHYTGFADIETLIDPVVMAPLRRDWDETRPRIESLLPVAVDPSGAPVLFAAPPEANRDEAGAALDGFLGRLRSVRVLDPACGSGNFLYVTLSKLKDLEFEALATARRVGLPDFPLQVGPRQLFGIEKNPYAFDLAQMTVWIGFLQWHRANGFAYHQTPVLQTLDTFALKDAILDVETNPEFPAEPTWPDADFIVGNPPFLGGSRIWRELGREYQENLWKVYEGRIPGGSDLCCYWFEKARAYIQSATCRRAGLIATQAIRGGVNRNVLKSIKASGDIFFAQRDKDWVLDGANVHVSLVGFDSGVETIRIAENRTVSFINSDLSTISDVTSARRLIGNVGIAFIGTKKGGKFNISSRLAVSWLGAPNPHARPNSDVLRPWRNGKALIDNDDSQWIVDFGTDMSFHDASLHEMPFKYVLENIKPVRDQNNRALRRLNWWIHSESCPGMRAQTKIRDRSCATVRVSKHRIFAWVTPEILCDDTIFVFARDDDYFFGVVHCRVHEVWARSQGTQVRERESGFRYTPTSCFETFPFPEPTPAQHDAIAAAAKQLDTLRTNWLNPLEWNRREVLEFPGSVDGPWARYVVEADERGIGTVRYPRLVPKDAYAPDLAKRTLTNLYNERPTWLDLAHRALDEAVFDAYGWSPGMSDEAILAALLDLNLARSGTGPNLGGAEDTVTP